MTRKDYILIARALRDAHETGGFTEENDKQVVLDIARVIAGALAADNPNFAHDHFLAVVRGEKALESRPRRGARVT